MGDASSITSIKLGEDTLIPVVAPNENGTPNWWLPDNPQARSHTSHDFVTCIMADQTAYQKEVS